MSRDGARLALGLLTVVPASVERVDRRTAASAMLWAPAVGFGLGAVLATAGWAGAALGLGPALVAVGAVAGLAVATRGLHLDGLADTADGLGSARPAAGALELMRRSDVGPFGVLTLVLVLLADVAALAQLVAGGWGLLAVLVPVTGRLVLPLVCRVGVPGARPDGLGALVAGTVGRRAALGAVAVGTAAQVAVAGLLALPLDADPARAALAVACAAAAGTTTALLLLRRCVRRLGGTTGDVMGACVEAAQCAALVVLVVGTGPLG